MTLVSSRIENMEKTFQLQDKLPSLPVPSLAQTCEKYLDSGTDLSKFRTCISNMVMKKGFPYVGVNLKEYIVMVCQTSQPQNTENLETDVKKSGDVSKNLEIDRLADKAK